MGLGEIELIREEAEHALVPRVVTHRSLRGPEIGCIGQGIDRVVLDEQTPVLVHARRGTNRRRLAIRRLLWEVRRLPVNVRTLEDLDGHGSARKSSGLERAPTERRIGGDRNVDNLTCGERRRGHRTTGGDLDGHRAVGEGGGVGVRREDPDDKG